MSCPDLKKAEEAGVLGIVCVWRECSEDNAAFQHLPFTKPHQNCPALWVGEKAGERLKELAGMHATAMLVLEAEVSHNASTDTLYAILPGRNTYETVLVNTHTDGPNAVEENGGIGLLALARYFAGVPTEERERTLVFIFVTGHFQLSQFGFNGQATGRWLRDHSELWDGKPGHAKAVAGIMMEHLGCMEWAEDGGIKGCYATGRPQLEFIYTGNGALDEICLESMKGRARARVQTLRPLKSIYFGEGQPLHGAGIPTISLVPSPIYLCASQPDGNIGKLDAELMQEQITAYAKVVSLIDKKSASQIGKPDREPQSLLEFVLRK